MKKNPLLNTFWFSNPYMLGSSNFKTFNKNIRDFQNIKFRDKTHIKETLKSFCDTGRFGDFKDLFLEFQYFQLAQGNQMVERDVLEYLPVNFKNPIFFKIKNRCDNLKHITTNKIFYQSVFFKFENQFRGSLIYQVKMKKNRKTNVFKFDSKTRSKIFFLKEYSYCFVTQFWKRKEYWITLFKLHSNKVCYHLWFPDDEVDILHTITRIDKCLVVILPRKIFFYQDRPPFQIRNIFSFLNHMVINIKYLPCRKMFLFFVDDSKKYRYSSNFKNNDYEFLHDMTEEKWDSEETNKIMRRLKKKYSDNPDSAFWYYTKHSKPIISVIIINA